MQPALLLRLRDQALRGELWAERLLRKVVGALPESGSEYEQVDMLEVQARFSVMLNEVAREKPDAASNSVETTNAE